MEFSNIQDLIQKLITLGEDREELEYWQSIYPDLAPEKQTELLQNLQEEVQALTVSNNNQQQP